MEIVMSHLQIEYRIKLICGVRKLMVGVEQ